MKGDGVSFFRGGGRCGEVLRSPWHPSEDFHSDRTSKNHSQEILQEAAGDLQEDLQEEAKSYFWSFEGGKNNGKGELKAR